MKKSLILHPAAVRFQAVKGTGTGQVMSGFLQHTAVLQEIPDTSEVPSVCTRLDYRLCGGATQPPNVNYTKADSTVFNRTLYRA